MSSKAVVATRKGLFLIARQNGPWRPMSVSFPGDNISMVLADRRDGALYAAKAHGHFGAKLHRSADEGKSWTELGTPQYPPKPEGEIDVDAVRQTPLEWNLELSTNLTLLSHENDLLLEVDKCLRLAILALCQVRQRRVMLRRRETIHRRSVAHFHEWGNDAISYAEVLSGPVPGHLLPSWPGGPADASPLLLHAHAQPLR